MTTIADWVRDVPLIDHHCHGLVRGDLDRPSFELLATESDWPQPTGQTIFDAPFGLVVRAHCAPILGLQRHCSAEQYWERRTELGAAITQPLLAAAGIDTYIVDTGFRNDRILGPAELADITSGRSREVVRLEQVAESIVGRTGASSFAENFAEELDLRAEHAVGFKSIIAYRYGLDFDPDRPDPVEVRRAAGNWLRRVADGRPRMDDPVLLRHLLWTAVDRGKPIQFHVGYGDSDITLHRVDPSHMTEFIRRTVGTGARIMLLHCYPFIREAGFLAQVYPHVYIDTGAALNYTGPQAQTLVRHSLEMAPFAKVLFSSDAFGLPELYMCGALLWRRAVAEVLQEWVDHDEMSTADGLRYIDMMARGNAARVYGIDT